MSKKESQEKAIRNKKDEAEKEDKFDKEEEVKKGKCKTCGK